MNGAPAQPLRGTFRPLARPAGVLLALAALLALQPGPRPAAAHPLGNFTVNRYSRLELSGDGLRVRYVLDAAEIPTFQAMAVLDANGDGRASDAERSRYASQQIERIAGNLRLSVGGASVPLRAASAELELLPGQAGLQTLRLASWLEAPGAAAALRRAGGAAVPVEYADANEPERIGWREIIVRAEGVTVAGAGGAAVPTHDAADELRRYPEDMLAGPLNVREIRLSVVPAGPAAGGAAPPGGQALGAGLRPLSRGSDGFAELFTAAAAGGLTPGIVALALLSATVLGGMHSMAPGHGKTIVGAYLVGARGTPRHALFLGLTVTLVHTAGVFALGLATLLASQYVIPERVYPWMSLVSGLLVLAMGGSLLRGRLRAAGVRAWPGPLAHKTRSGPAPAAGTLSEAHCDACAAQERLLATHLLRDDSSSSSVSPSHSHPYPHSRPTGAHGAHGGLTHDHGFRGHTHAVPGADGRPVGWRGLLALGVSGGLLPCPSALVVMLGAIALQQVAFGLVLILFFSLGLAGTLVAVGLLMVYSGRVAGRLRLLDRMGAAGGRGGGVARWLRLAPVASAAVVGLAGLALSVEALRQIDPAALWESSGQFRTAVAVATAGAAAALAVWAALRDAGRRAATHHHEAAVDAHGHDDHDYLDGHHGGHHGGHHPLGAFGHRRVAVIPVPDPVPVPVRPAAGPGEPAAAPR